MGFYDVGLNNNFSPKTTGPLTDTTVWKAICKYHETIIPVGKIGFVAGEKQIKFGREDSAQQDYTGKSKILIGCKIK